MFGNNSIFFIFNLLYKYFFIAYKPLYFIYKHLSDRNLIKYLHAKVQEGDVALDIGANIGFYSLFLSKLVGNKGQVLAFEPDEINFSRLKNTVTRKKNIHVSKYAISDRTSEIDFYISSRLNVDHHTFDIGENREVVKVQAVSVDDFLEKNYPHLSIDFIKIDIQGFDCFALLGMKRTILKSGKLTIVGEYWPYALQKVNQSAINYYEEMIRLGFDVKFIPSMSIAKVVEKKNDPSFYINFIAES